MNNIKELLKEWGSIVFTWLVSLGIILSIFQWIIKKEVAVIKAEITTSEQRIKTEIALIDQSIKTEIALIDQSIKTIKENDLKHITDDIKEVRQDIKSLLKRK